MESKVTDFINISRSIQQHFLYPNKRKFTEFEAWMDMLLMAEPKECKKIIGKQLIVVSKGDFFTSQNELSKRWMWSRDIVRNFISILQNDFMISCITTSQHTKITICNYGKYQEYSPTKHQRNTNETPTKHQRNKEGKPITDVGKTEEIFCEYLHLKLTISEYEKLIKELPQSEVDEIIEIIKGYSVSYLKKYASFSKTIRSWIKRNKQQPNTYKRINTELEEFKKQNEDTFTEFKEAYFNFHINIRQTAPPMWETKHEIANVKLIKYFLCACKEDVGAAIAAVNRMYMAWNTLDDFHRKMVDITQIAENLTPIIDEFATIRKGERKLSKSEQREAAIEAIKNME
jgi:hypothetical protein